MHGTHNARGNILNIDFNVNVIGKDDGGGKTMINGGFHFLKAGAFLFYYDIVVIIIFDLFDTEN